MPIVITNETHWRTPDVRRLIQACLDVVNADPARKRTVNVIYHVKRRKKKRRGSKAPAAIPVSSVDYDVKIRPRSTVITLKFPKNGPKDLHSNAMTAIAAAAAAPGEGELLSPSETFWLANHLAYDLAENEPGSCEKEVEYTRTRNRGGFPGQPTRVETYVETVTEKDYELIDQLEENRGSDMPPAWCDASKALICKVKDPLKDGTYIAFVKKKEAQLKRALTTIETETAAIEAAKRRLKKAKDRKKEIERSLKSARERRTS